MGFLVKPYSGGIRHDYKDSLFTQRRVRNRRWSWFAAGLAVPLSAAALFLVSEPNESRMTAEYAASGTESLENESLLGAEPLLPSPPEAAVEQPALAASAADTDAEVASVEAAAVPSEESAEKDTGPPEMAVAAAGDTRSDEAPAAKPVAAVAAVEQSATRAETSNGTPMVVYNGRTTTIPLALPENGQPVTLDYSASGSDLSAAAAINLIVNRGDTLDQLFRRNGLSITDLHAMVNLQEASRHLRILRPGDQIGVTHEDGRVMSLTRELDEIRMLTITRGEDGYAAETVERDVEIRVSGAHGVIRNSLFGAGVAAGVSDTMIMTMANIFQWDIDFIQDVRVGDEFTVVYEELWRDGEKLRDGGILAVEFVNQGRSYRAARFQDNEGRASYFTPEGRSMRRAFLRAPVDFTRISSNFDLNRRHPVLNTIRAHRGVDYAAPTGTPIRAAGDGRIQFRGVQGGYGNTVIIEHGGGITTLYAHMSRFGEHRQGSRVRQGDIIGYVGMTGLATGPHLHYEYRVNGVHRNPRTVPLPDADPIPAQYRADFDASTAPLWRQLELYQRSTRLASLD